MCWGVGGEEVLKEVWESVGGNVLGLPMPQHTLPHLPQHFPTLPISPYLPHTPTHFPTPLPTSPSHPNTLFHTYPNTSPHLPSPTPRPDTLPNTLHTPYSPHTLSHTSKKIMLKCFYIRCKPEKYVGTIEPMTPVKSEKKKKKSNMSATRKHI